MFLLLVAAAHAAPKVHVVAGTRAPLSVGGKARVEVPGRVQLGAGAGYLPGGYVDVINGVAMSFDAYGESTANVIKAAIQSSLVVDADVAWRPFPEHGFTFGAGYSLVTLGGDASGQELLAAAAGVEAPEEPSGGPGGRFDVGATDRTYDMAATVHMLRPELGWQVPIGENLLLDFGLGGAFTVAASAAIEPEFDPASEELQEAFTSETEAWLVDEIESWVHSPTLSIGFGGRFGGP